MYHTCPNFNGYLETHQSNLNPEWVLQHTQKTIFDYISTLRVQLIAVRNGSGRNELNVSKARLEWFIMFYA